MPVPFKVSLAVVAACSLTVVPRIGAAQHITVDGRFSPAMTLNAVGGNYAITADLGKQVGSNLFHSFGQFSLATLEKATFSATGSTVPIGNVISRVTGGSGSKIDGTIQSNIAGANLYLINPNGILFGPNATVNVSGSFHASTADYLKLQDGARFQATNPDASKLSAAPPAAFGFLTPTPRPIGVSGALGPVPGTLGLVAGPISIVGGTLTAPGGTIHVASAAGTGEVPIDPRNTPALTVKTFGPVDIKGSTLDVGNLGVPGPGGSVFIHAGALTISASDIGADNYGSAPGGVITLRGETQVSLTESTFVHAAALGSGGGAGIVISTAPSGIVSIDAGTVLTDSSGSGDGGPLSLETGRLTLTNGAGLTSSTEGSGKGGPIKISASSVLLDGAATSIASITTGEGLTGPSGNRIPAGAGGAISITAGSLTIQGGASIAGTSAGDGAGGAVALNTGGPLTVANLGSITSVAAAAGDGGPIAIAAGAMLLDGSAAQSLPTGIITAALGSGKAGDVAVTRSGTLTILTNGALGSVTFGSGDAGSVSVNVAGSLTIDGKNANPNLFIGTGISSLALGSKGNAGQVQVEASSLAITNGGVISASTFGSLGNAGNLMVHAGTLSIASNGGISSDTSGSGNGGRIFVTVDGQLSVDGSGVAGFTGIQAQTTGTDERPKGGQHAGNITVDAGTLSILGNGRIVSSTFGTGDAGSVSVRVAGLLSIDGMSSTSLSGIATDAEPGSTGNAGVVTVNAGSLSIVNTGQISSNTFGAGSGGSVFVTVPGRLSINGNSARFSTGIFANSNSSGENSGDAGSVTVSAGDLRIGGNGGQLSTNTSGSGKAGNVLVSAATLSIADNGEISSNTSGSGMAGNVAVSTETLSIAGNAAISSVTFGKGNAGNVSVRAAGHLSIDGNSSTTLSGIASDSEGENTGNSGLVTVNAGTLSIVNTGQISSNTFGAGSGGSVFVTVAGRLSISGVPGPFDTGIFATSSSSRENSGDAGTVTVSAGDLVIAGSGGQVSTNTHGSGKAGSVTVTAGSLSILKGGSISSDTFGPGHAGGVSVSIAGELTIAGAPESGFTGISSDTILEGTGGGNAGNVMVSAGTLSISGNGGQISASTFGAGAGGNVSVTAGMLSLANLGAVASVTFGSGNGGNVAVSVSGQLSIEGTPGDFLTGIAASSQPGSTGNAGNVTVQAGSASIVNNKGEIASSTFGRGNGGQVSVDVAGLLSIDGAPATQLTGIAAQSFPGFTGNAGRVIVSAGELAITNNGQISVSTQGPGSGGDVAVAVAGPVTLRSGGQVTAATEGAGNGGAVHVLAQGPLSLSDSGSGIIALASSTASGDAGLVTVSAPQIAITRGAEIASTTAGTGMGGSVTVTTPGMLVLDGAGVAITQIAASAIGPRSGPGGSVRVTANALTIEGGAQIASSTAGPGKGGDIAVTVANGANLSGSGPNGAGGISAAALTGSSGAAGEVVLTAGGAIALSNGAAATSSTAGAGNGGSVRVTAGGPLSLTGAGTGIIASAKAAANGDAGLVTVSAPQITITRGAEIASTTAGTGMGGSVTVTTPGTLVLDGAGVADTQIAASAIGLLSGRGGDVTVVANALTIEGGAQIASSTAGPGKGGDVDVMVASDIVLPDPGPQITARSTGSGDAGSITLSAVRLLLSNGAAISTEAETSTANGGNVTLHVRDFLYLVSSEITTSVKGETGNGGNITIDPQLVILNHSSIIAEAVKGHGGNITITAGQFIPSTDSIISATSELGISGEVVINGPRVDVNGALVVLSTQLRGRTEILREACAARADRPLSSLVEAGRGGLPQDPEATLPALYIAGRDLSVNSTSVEKSAAPIAPLHTTARLSMRCG